MGASKSESKKSNVKHQAKQLFKNPTFYIALIGLVVVVAIAVTLIIIGGQARHRNQVESLRDAYITLGHGHNSESSDSAIADQIVTSYADFTRAIEKIDFDTRSSRTITEADFKEHNYAIIVVRYDSCSEKNLEPSVFEANKDQISITFDYESTCGGCAPEYLFYAFKLDKTITNAHIAVNYHSVSSEHCDPNVVYKPLIYLYPTKTTNVTVRLGHPELITTSYPKYENQWQVTATPSGELTDKSTGREYYALYWEGRDHFIDIQSTGFVIKGDQTAIFLEEKLATLGLTAREAEEFIVYWLPKMEHNKYNYIHFESASEIDSYMPLEITPQPDTTIRVYMSFKALESPISVTQQHLTSPVRTGFTVVEWGGTEIK